MLEYNESINRKEMFYIKRYMIVYAVNAYYIDYFLYATDEEAAKEKFYKKKGSNVHIVRIEEVK